MAEKKCNNCNTKENKTGYDLAVAVCERTTKRLWIAIIVLIILNIVGPLAVHLGWVYYESQWETVDYAYEYTQDGQGTNIIGDSNEVLNGAETISESENTP